MTSVVLLENLPRLRGLLLRLGVALAPPASAPQDALYVGPDPTDADRPTLSLIGSFPWHQARQIVRAMGFVPRPEDAAPAADKRLRQLFLQTLSAPNMAGAGELHEPEVPPLEVLEPTLDVHQAMEVAWVEHRLALMAGTLDTALQHLERFQRAMTVHLNLENERVLSAYRAHPPGEGYVRGGAPEIFETEHRRILDRLSGFERWLKNLIAQRVTGDDCRLACLHMLDREKVFTDLLEHHDHRERAYLYPHLEAVLPRTEKEALVEATLHIDLSPSA